MLVALSCATLLAAPSAASAIEGQPLNDPLVSSYLQVAAAQWGGPAPTCTQPDGSVVQLQVMLFNDPDPGVAARAEEPGCRMYLDSDFFPGRPDEINCTIVVHEWGHLLGYPHSPDPKNVMYELPTGGAPGCAQFAPDRVEIGSRGFATSSHRARRARRSRHAARPRGTQALYRIRRGVSTRRMRARRRTAELRRRTQPFEIRPGIR